MHESLTRRSFLTRTGQASALAALGARTPLGAFAGEESKEKLPVAGITTVYRRNSHSDVILGKILEGYRQQGGPGPGLKLASLYVDQVPENDLSRKLAAKHGVPIFESIEEAVTLGGKGVPVAGVLSIAEHGDYPYTEETRQHMYPRRRFFDAIAAAFQKGGRAVPVFSDKHLSWNWKDARHMYETARQMEIPMMAGSSIPVAWRRPPLELPMGCRIEEAVGVGYGGLESYGFHGLEGLQCMVERRKGGETGIVSVQAVQGDGIWKAEREGRWSRDLLLAALERQPQFKRDRWEERLAEDAAFYLIEYADGLKATLAMAGGLSRHFSFAARLAGKAEPASCLFALENEKPYGHFGYLVEAIEQMVRTGEPAYPVERTLLTTGVLDRAMHSLAEGERKYATPELAIEYEPADWPFATGKVGKPPGAGNGRR